MVRRRHFLKGLAASAVALGIGTVEASKAARVVEPDALNVDLAKVDPTISEAQESGYARMQELAKLRGAIIDLLPEDRIITLNDATGHTIDFIGHAPNVGCFASNYGLFIPPPSTPNYATSWQSVAPTDLWPVWKDGQLVECREIPSPNLPERDT